MVNIAYFVTIYPILENADFQSQEICWSGDIFLSKPLLCLQIDASLV